MNITSHCAPAHTCLHLPCALLTLFLLYTTNSHSEWSLKLSESIKCLIALLILLLVKSMTWQQGNKKTKTAQRKKYVEAITTTTVENINAIVGCKIISSTSLRRRCTRHSCSGKSTVTPGAAPNTEFTL